MNDAANAACRLIDRLVVLEALLGEVAAKFHVVRMIEAKGRLDLDDRECECCGATWRAAYERDFHPKNDCLAVRLRAAVEG